MRYDIWADPNHIFRGKLQTLLRFANNPTGIQRGERVTVGTRDGWRAKAKVLDVWTNQLVFLEIDWTAIWEEF